jgi:curved DNA-binding protein CbpA
MATHHSDHSDHSDHFEHSDHYAVLGISPDASPQEIAHAFRRQARVWHPDARPGDADAAARFREIATAYEVLADPRLRARYDRRWKARSPDRSQRAEPAQPTQPTQESPRASRARPVRVRHVPAGESQNRQSPVLRAGPARWIEDRRADSTADLLARLRAMLRGRW